MCFSYIQNGRLISFGLVIAGNVKNNFSNFIQEKVKKKKFSK